MMKSKNSKIQKILMKGMAISLSAMMTFTPLAYAATSLDDSSLDVSFMDKLLYGTIGATVKEIEEYFSTEGKTTLYIQNETQLRALAEYVNNGNNCEGKTIKLIKDIQINSNEEWVPIGIEDRKDSSALKKDNPFGGVFDGQGHVIRGLYADKENKTIEDLDYFGLFGKNTGTIKNIELTDSKIDFPYDIGNIEDYYSQATDTATYGFTGGIVGINYGNVENCIVKDNVMISSDITVGGIAGINSNGTIKNCINQATINALSTAGGIVGYNWGNYNVNGAFFDGQVAKVLNCKNTGKINTLTGSSGGIAGSQKWTSIIQKCENSGTVSLSTAPIVVAGQTICQSPENVGGIVGWIAGGTEDDGTKHYTAIDGCINRGKVIGYRDVGGIAGQVIGIGRGHAIMRHCVNYSSNIVATIPIDKIEFYNDGCGARTEFGDLIGDAGATDDDDKIYLIYDDSVMTNPVVGKTNVDATKEEQQSSASQAHRLVGYAAWKKENISELRNLVNTIVSITGNTYPIKVDSNEDDFSSKESYSNIELTVDGSKKLFEKKDDKWELIKSINKSVGVLDTNNENIKVIVNYTISKKASGENSYAVVNGNTYFKEGDIIKVTAKFDKYLASTYGPLTQISTAPTLKLNDSIIMTAGKVNTTTSEYTTTIEYTYTVKAGDNVEIKSLDLSKSGTIYAISGSDYSTNHPTISTSSKSISVEGLIMDTTAPIVKRTAYVENKLATGRYTAGKEIIIETTTSEPIQDSLDKNIYQAPSIQVSFSESGTGKYNYDTKSNPATVGYAKCKDARINVDGTTTWTYSYIIQEGDEGDLELTYQDGVITDLAGNVTNIKELYTPQPSTGTKVTGNLWDSNLGVTYEFYKNSVSDANKVTPNTYFTKDDDLIAVATYNKVLYVHYGLSDGKNTNVRLTNSYKDRAPSLYLNGDTALENTSTSITTATNSTVITYTFDINSYNLNELTNIESVTLKNENNTATVSTNGTTAMTNGLIPFATEWYQTYQSEDESKYKTISSNAITTTNIENIVLDPIGVSNNIEQDDIYADTTAPTVQIQQKGWIQKGWIQKGWIQKGETITNGIVELKIGDYVNYDEGTGYTYTADTSKGAGRSATYNSTTKRYDLTAGDAYTTENLGWRVLGVNTKGELELISDNPTTNSIYLANEEGYVNAESVLNDFCNTLYGKGEHATGARSLNVEDINQLANYDPTTNSSYNKKWKYKAESNYYSGGQAVIQYSEDGGQSWKPTSFKTFKIPGQEAINNTNNPGEEELTSTYYSYNIADKVKQTASDGKSMADIISKGTGTGDINQWLASSCVICNSNNANFDVRYVGSGSVDYYYLFSSSGRSFSNNFRVRPVVSLKSNIQLKATENGSYDICEDDENINDRDDGKYTFDFLWSEKVKEFTKDNITVKNAKIESLEKSRTNPNLYTAVIETTIPNGNVGEMEIIVEQDACKDLVGLSNVRSSKTITIDRKAPILIGLEAYATSDVALGNSIHDVKENYKTGDTVTIVATFDENIKNSDPVPTLALQFSKSGNAKGNVSTGTIDGNKITYTYTIAAGDTGELSVKGFTGTVIDVAGNETRVTKRALDGDTIIADSEAPKIVGITAIAPDFKYDQFVKNNEEDTEYLNGETKRYGVKEQIKFLVEFNEELYHLDSNKKVEKIVSETAPTLKIKFGTGTTRDAEFSKIDGKVLEYTYDIQSGDNGNLSSGDNGNLSSGDNGNLSLVSMTGAISDIAGNSITNHSLVTLAKYEETITEENKVDNIMADTTSSTVKVKVTQIENDGLTGTQNHYKAGNILTITATTNEYVYSKSGNNLSKITSESAPSLGIKFGEESAKGSLKCTKVDYIYDENSKTTETVFTYEYVIATGDNGEISLSFGENKYYDIALNGNAAGTKDSSSKTVIADTIAPNTSHLQGTNDNSYIKDNGDGTYSVLFTEKLYYLNNNIVTALTSSNIKANGPVLVLKDGEEYQQVKPSSISTVDEQTMITYNYGKAGVTRIGLDNYDKICDIAGNMYNDQVKIVPTLLNIKITSPEDKTAKYRTDTEVTIVATFTKRVQGTVPTLKIKFGEEGTERSISSGTIDKDTITYQYTIQEGDNGTLRVVSLEGNGLRGEDGTLYKAPETISLTGETLTADTTKPTVQIKAYTDYKTSSKKEVSGKINAEVTTYEFTWSEEVRDFAIEDITVINGIKDTFTKVSNKVYTLDVINSNEGVQTVAVPSEVCTDIAKIGRYDEETGEYVVEDIGNSNESARINSIEIDRTAPTVRFITPNGGNYTTSTDTGKANLKARIEINEEVDTFKYRVVKEGETVPEYNTISGDNINSSDIDIKINNVEEGEYVVEVIAVDKAGNEKQAKSNKYIVKANAITLTANKTTATNEDITVTVNYGEALTENRKAGIQGKTQSADSSKVIIGENGTIYAEAADIAGNKVYATLEITNIDKTAPKATISYVTNEDGSVTATITFDEEATVTNNDGKLTYKFTENGEFTFEFVDSVGNNGTATAKVININKKEPTEPDTPPVEEDTEAPEITFNYTSTTATVGTTIGATITSNEDAIISYSWDNENWTSSSDYTRSVNARRTPTNAGTYTLYAKATDKSSNTSAVSRLQFTVVASESDIIKPEVIFEDLTTIQKDGVKYVKISPTFTTAELTAKMDEDALREKTPEYTKLTSDKDLRTGSEITIDGDTKYIVIVNGDVNCDGKVDFLNDIVMINNYRIGINKNLSDIQVLAGDINNSGTIEFIPDIVAMNNYRLGRIKVL